MGVVCFRCVPAGMADVDVNRLNVSIVESVNASGDAYITHTQLGRRTAIRVGFGNVLTTEQHLASAWARILAERDRLLDLRAHMG
jgi:aromatic-L-amino-acid decarboxylase